MLITLWKSSVEVPQKTKNKPSIRSSNTITGHILKDYAPGYCRATCTLMFITAAQHPSFGNSLDSIKLMNGLSKCGTWIQWSTIQL
jgi:hypothetical protein